MRLRLDLGYDGAGFSGWARQPGRRTVQGELETVLGRLLRLDAVTVTCAGRTDAGVHARGQVAHVDLPQPVEDGFAERLARALPDDLAVKAVTEADPGFDARFSAVWRRYVYRVCDHPAHHDPLTRGHVLRWPRPVSAIAIMDAADALLGEHDFAAFCRPRPGASTVRTLLGLTALRPCGVVELTAVADGFCHNMVRSLVGMLLAVGEGRLPADEPARILARCVRDPRVQVAPPHGLTLEEVGYPPAAELAGRADQTRRRRALAR